MKKMSSPNVVCPYYRCEERQKIFCEGGYGGCRISDMLERKWDDAGKE